MVYLVHLWDQHTGLVAEDIVDYVWLKRIIHAVLVSHDLSCRVHLKSKVGEIILQGKKPCAWSKSPPTLLKMHLTLLFQLRYLIFI